MRKHLSLTLLLIAYSLCAMAQNILQNPSFAEKTDCPQSIEDMSFCKYWRSPTKSTPVYYNNCYDSSALGPGVPQSWWAYQESYSKSYAGIIGFHYGAYREYIATTFPALIPGKKYRVSIFVSLADSAANATAGLGVFFYKDAVPDYHTHGRIPVTPQIDYTSQGIIANDTEWVALSATFIADSAYDKLAIGNYHHDTDYLLDTDSLMLITAIKPGLNINYYLIDSVSVAVATDEAGVNGIEPEMTSVSVRPNPARGRYTFTFGKAGDHRLTIYNALGVAVVSREHITSKDITIERGMLPPGNYFYVAEQGGDIASRGRILLE